MFHRIIFVALFCVFFQRTHSAHLRNVVVDFASEDETFRGNIHVNGKAYPLTLQRAVDSVLSPNFRLTETIRAPSGKIILRDIQLTIPVSEIERNIYVDEDADAAFKMDRVDGVMRLHGIVDNIHISHDGQDHVAVIQDFSAMNFQSDYVPTNLTKDDSIDDRAVTVANPELFFTLDYKRFLDGGSDEQNVPEYLAILVRSVNNRFKTFSDPSIKHKIVGCTIIKSPEAQPFIEEARATADKDGAMSIRFTLRRFGNYMYNLRRTNRDLPSYDLAPLLTTENFGNTLGIAPISGACREDDENERSKSVLVCHDKHVSWFSRHTLSHELGHILGANHDGEGSSKACNKSEGFIMGHDWVPKNRMTFSSCSRDSMKKLINSKEGACLRRNDASGAWPEAPKDPGWYITMDESCRRYYSDECPDVTVYSKRSPDEMCSELMCLCNGSVKRPPPQYTAPPNGTPCGSNGGRCQSFKCVA